MQSHINNMVDGSPIHEESICYYLRLFIYVWSCQICEIKHIKISMPDGTRFEPY